LGIDSAFSLCEGFSTCVKDSRLFKDIPREALIGLICLMGYCINISMLFVGYVECLSAGWIAYSKEQTERIGARAWWTMLGAMIFSSIISPRLGLGLGSFETFDRYGYKHWVTGTIVGILAGPLLFTAGVTIAVREARKHREAKSLPCDLRNVLSDLLLYNVECLRGKLNEVVGAPAGNVSIPFFWSLLVKFFIPPVMMVLLLMKIKSPAYGNYEGYPDWYQGWGLFLSYVPWLAFLVGLLAPQVYDLMMPEGEVTLDSLKEKAQAEESEPKSPTLLKDSDGATSEEPRKNTTVDL